MAVSSTAMTRKVQGSKTTASGIGDTSFPYLTLQNDAALGVPPSTYGGMTERCAWGIARGGWY